MPITVNSASNQLVQQLTKPIAAALKHPWVEHIVRLSAVEDALSALHPLLSLTHVRARVVRVIDETLDTKTFVLQPNALWRAIDLRAGQFVQVQVEINGRRVERAYSVSSRPGARRLAITVKRQPGGLMSEHLHNKVKAGDVLTLSQAAGEFVLPTQLPAELSKKVLLLSAGSGITPVMAMLRDLHRRQNATLPQSVAFVHVCRTPSDLIFARDLHAMAASMPSLSLVIHTSQIAGRFDATALQAAVPDWAERSTWLCGPAAFMSSMQQHWHAAGLASQLQTERFSAAPLLPLKPGAPVAVTWIKSAKTFTAQGTEPLLVQAERAGLAPKHGCRIGICRSCQCVKKTGTVQNLQTGELSSAPNELIRLCVSAARSDVALDL
jgi:stearoyl-CoA 9-desaturase NADPH oxidoreductase